MAASATDYFIKVRQNFSTTIGAGGVADGTVKTIPLTSVANLPTDTAIELVINRITSAGVVTNNSETVRGVISGSGCIDTVRGVEGTAQGWDAGTVVEYLVTADIQNRMVTGILQEVNQSGIHSTSIFNKLTLDQTITGLKTYNQSAIFNSGFQVNGLSTFEQSAVFNSSSFFNAPMNVSQSALFQSGIWLNGVPLTNISDGWISSNETWTYVSASTFTVSGNVTDKYTKGTRLKWTQTTVKYGVVVASSYSAPNTTVTILINTNYTIADAEISANYYSYQMNPQGYPGWFTLAAPTFDVNQIDNASGGQPTITEHRAKVDGNYFFDHFRGTGTKAGANWYFSWSTTGFPTPANTSDQGCLGAGIVVASGIDRPGIIKKITTSFWFVTDSTTNIADNLTITGFGADWGYEI